MAEALDLPEGHVSFGDMMVGQPKFKYPRIGELLTKPYWNNDRRLQDA